ncbi:hypothetical protein [Gorillibacterium sp. CAU 1737]|uniref:hypothetical protein n=1 Tax=Gorillibacterium sp. CAU 1737 TaxID=3140362 RepID=UPI00326105EF
MGKGKIALLLLAMGMALSGCQEGEASKPASAPLSERKAKLTKATVDVEKKDNWWVVPGDRTNLTFQVEASNTDTVLFWYYPAGTDVEGEKTLLGYDSDGRDGWSFTWEFEKRVFHEYILVQAIGSDGASLASETFNLHTEDGSE